MKPFLLTLFSLVAFALNSILCRMALRTDEIDAASFTAVRLVSGAIALYVLLLATRKTQNPAKTGRWVSAFLLFAYAVCFSFAYIGLSAGTGALILFGSVQLTMIVVALAKGERPSLFEWAGLSAAIGGLVYLTLPGLDSPPVAGSLLMAAAGSAWGLYTLRGRSTADPLALTAGNFFMAVPFAAMTIMWFWSGLHLSVRGTILAVLSGAVASGVGYTVWYAALRYHTSTRAAVLQLAVPVLAALGGVLLMDEAATARLAIASALILGGIAVAIAGRKKRPA